MSSPLLGAFAPTLFLTFSHRENRRLHMIRHENFKVYRTYKDVLCQYLDGVNYDFEHLNTLNTTMNNARKRHPHAFVWYEVVNVRPYNAPNGKVYRKCRCLCDVRVIYRECKPEKSKKLDLTNKPAVTLTVRNDGDVIRMGKYTIIKSADGNYAVEGSEFVGTLDDCTKYVNYVRTAPECYKNRAVKCHNMEELIFRTDISGTCNTAIHTTQNKPTTSMAFHQRMARGNRYAW